jgi:hypothetical protein
MPAATNIILAGAARPRMAQYPKVGYIMQGVCFPREFDIRELFMQSTVGAQDFSAACVMASSWLLHSPRIRVESWFAWMIPGKSFFIFSRVLVPSCSVHL